MCGPRSNGRRPAASPHARRLQPLGSNAKCPRTPQFARPSVERPMPSASILAPSRQRLCQRQAVERPDLRPRRDASNRQRPRQAVERPMPSATILAPSRQRLCQPSGSTSPPSSQTILSAPSPSDLAPRSLRPTFGLAATPATASLAAKPDPNLYCPRKRPQLRRYQVTCLDHKGIV
jgi:hypothetical protein